MTTTPAFISVLFAASLSWVFLLGLIPILRQNLLDRPNERSSHYKPTPRGGGVVFVFVACLSSLLAWFFQSGFSAPLPLLLAPLLAFPLAFVGILDDLYNLSVSWRFGVQIVTGLVVVLLSPLLSPSVALLPSLVFLVITVTAVINFTNFMDGLDGLVAGCMALVISVAAFKLSAPWPIWALVGSLFGFLLWNWSPAQVFMGDVGSTFLGTVLVILVLQASSWSEALSILLLATPILADALFCVLRRLFSGQRVFQAHRLHLFQRLYQAGWSHASVSSLYIAATFLLSCALMFGGLSLVIFFSAFVLLIGIWLDQQVAVPFVLASQRSNLS